MHQKQANDCTNIASGVMDFPSIVEAGLLVFVQAPVEMWRGWGRGTANVVHNNQMRSGITSRPGISEKSFSFSVSTFMLC